MGLFSIVVRCRGEYYAPISSMRGGDWPRELLSAWDARDDEQKFQLVCVVHDEQVYSIPRG